MIFKKSDRLTRVIQPYRPDTEYAKRLALAFIESFLIILLFFLLFPMLRKMTASHIQPIQTTPAVLTIDTTRTAPQMPVQKPPMMQKQPEFMPTDPAQASKVAPKDPKFFSAENTIAASSSQGKEDNTNPNQEGAKVPGLGFVNQKQSAALEGSGGPPQKAQPAQPQQPSPQQQSQQQAKEQSQQQQAKPDQQTPPQPQPKPVETQPQQQTQQPPAQEKQPEKTQDQQTASPSQVKPLDTPPKNPTPDVKQTDQTAAPKPDQAALMSSDSKTAELVKFNEAPKLRPEKVADTATVSAPEAAQTAPKPQIMNMADLNLAQLAALNPRSSGPPPSPLNPGAQASSPSASPSTFEQQTAIEGGRRASISSITSYDTAASPLGKYVQYILMSIKSRWLGLVSDPNKIGLLKVGNVRAKFDLLANGTVTNIRLVSDSNDVIFTGLCHDAIYRGGVPYNPFPSEVAATLGDKKEFEISFALY